MARKQRKMIQIADPDLFAKTKDVLAKFGEHLDGHARSPKHGRWRSWYARRRRSTALASE